MISGQNSGLSPSSPSCAAQVCGWPRVPTTTSRAAAPRRGRNVTLSSPLRYDSCEKTTTGSTVLASYGKLRVALDTISVVTRLFD